MCWVVVVQCDYIVYDVISGKPKTFIEDTISFILEKSIANELQVILTNELKERFRVSLAPETGDFDRSPDKPWRLFLATCLRL